MADLSQRAYQAYRNLVYETPGFTDYFFAATPIAEIAELNLGSRPASRKSTRRIEDLRAIPGASPGASAACCCRAGTASARGVGLAAGRQQGATPGAAAEMFKEWPFFATLLSNMDMVLAKTDLPIASRYAELVPDAELRERDLQAHLGEHGETCAAWNDHRQRASAWPATRCWRARSRTASPTSIR
jgi:phosphoenolpyruvate carboxylase